MHVQNTDSYSSQFGRENSYRFDKALWTTIASYLFGGYDENVMGPSGGPAPGTQNSYNPVPSYAYEQTFWYEVPDVNYDDTDYHFTGMNARVWDWYLSPSTGYYVADDEDDFPLMPLTASYWRGIMVEDDDDVTTMVRRGGDWSGDVSTFNFGSGGHQTLFTKIDARGQWFGTNDRVFQDSGFRRANQQNVNARTNFGGVPAPAETNGFKYVFVRKTIQPFDP